MTSLLASWWMQTLKVHAPVLMTETVLGFLMIQGLLLLLQRTQTFESPRTQSHWRPFGFAGSALGLGLALLFSIHSAMSAIGHQRQLQALLQALRGGVETPAQTGAQTQTPAGSQAEATAQQQEAANQAKAEFLQKIAAYLEKPEATNIEEARARLAKDYPGLLEKNGDAVRAQYREAITSVYQCQKAFLDDIIATLKNKRVEKSAFRAKCEATSGAFFLRPLLIPEEQARTHEATLQALGRGEKVGEPPITMESAKRGAETEKSRLDLLQKILK